MDTKYVQMPPTMCKFFHPFDRFVRQLNPIEQNRNIKSTSTKRLPFSSSEWGRWTLRKSANLYFFQELNSCPCSYSGLTPGNVPDRENVLPRGLARREA